VSVNHVVLLHQLAGGFKVSELYTVFLHFGNVGEVYVPLKCDRRGRRFGFVKFQDVVDEEVLGFRLGEVWLGDSRLELNKARFGRVVKVVVPVPVRKKATRGSGLEVSKVLSFKQVVAHESSIDAAIPTVLRRAVVQPSEVRLKELESCFVAALSYHREPKLVRQSLMLGGLEKIGVTSMGANMVLLKAEDPQLIEEADRRCDPWWRGLFKSVKRWAPNMVAKHRMVRLRVFGLPLHVWEEKTFKLLGALFGDFVDFDEETIGFNRFDMARLCVCSPSLVFINERIRLEVMGAVFDVWVMEEVVSAEGFRRSEDSGWEEVSSESSHGGGVQPELRSKAGSISSHGGVDVGGCGRKEVESGKGPMIAASPSSGLRLILDEEGTQVPESPLMIGGIDPLKKLEASSLFERKNVLGFSFSTPGNENKVRLEKMEVLDVEKKVIRENRSVIQ